MSKIRILVGTRKGAFIITSDGQRKNWGIDGHYFGGWEIYHVAGSPVNPDRIYVSQTSEWFGQIIQRSDDGGKTWQQPDTPPGEPEPSQESPSAQSNKFAYDVSEDTGKPLITHHSSLITHHSSLINGMTAHLIPRNSNVSGISSLVIAMPTSCMPVWKTRRCFAAATAERIGQSLQAYVGIVLACSSNPELEACVFTPSY